MTVGEYYLYLTRLILTFVSKEHIATLSESKGYLSI